MRLLFTRPVTCHATSDEVQSAPELSVLSALSATAHAASLAVAVANPELLNPEHLAGLHYTAALACARRLLTDLDLLVRSVDAYRTAVAALVPLHPLSDDDFPF